MKLRAYIAAYIHARPSPERIDAKKTAFPLGGFQLTRIMEKTCPHCGFGVKEKWHRRYGIQKLDRGWLEAGLPVVGRVKLRKEALVMVYVCELTNLPFLAAVPRAK